MVRALGRQLLELTYVFAKRSCSSWTKDRISFLSLMVSLVWKYLLRKISTKESQDIIEPALRPYVYVFASSLSTKGMNFIITTSFGTLGI